MILHLFRGDPFYTFRAHAFQIDQRTKRSWIPLSSDAVVIRVSYDSGSGCVYLASDPADGNSGISSSLASGTQITKTSSKFVQWLDRSGSVFGLGFANESDLNKFIGHYNSVWASNPSSTPPPPPMPNTAAASNLGASMPPVSAPAFDQQKPIYAPSQTARATPRPPAPPPQTPQPPPTIALKQQQTPQGPPAPPPPPVSNYALLTNFQPAYNAPADGAAAGQFIDLKAGANSTTTAGMSNGTGFTSIPTPSPAPPPPPPLSPAVEQLTSELSNLRIENQKLRESVLTSNTNVKKCASTCSIEFD